MLFQTLDDKENCVAVYLENKLVKEVPDSLSKTWAYSAFLKGRDIEYANLYCEGKKLIEVCPEEDLQEWNLINNKLRAFYNSFKEAKVSLRENCFFDLIPYQFLLKYCFYKNKITEYVLNNYKRPQEYGFFREMTELLTEIKFQDIIINTENLNEEEKIAFFDKVKDKKNYVDYNLFGTITGRLTATKNSFPILTLSKDLRKAIEPTNDWFVELDMNAAELRTAFALLGRGQVVGDLHEWNVQNIFNNELNRTEAKNVAISWLYNSSSKLALQYDQQLSKVFDKKYLKDHYYNGTHVLTPFGRKIESDDYHVNNYLNQSTLIDVVHRQVIKMWKKMTGESKIAFLLHDAVVLDLKEEEKNQLPELIKEFSNTQFGIFPANVKIGKNFGDMKKIKIKV